MCLQPSGGRPSSPRKPQSDLALTFTGKCSRLPGSTAKRRIKLKSFSLDSSVAPSVDTTLHPPHPASPASLERSPPPTSLPDDSASLPSRASSAPTSVPALSAPTLPRPVTLTPAPPGPATLAPAAHVVPTPPTRVSFGPGTLEALPYADVPQAPYPPSAISEADDLASTTRTTAKEIRQHLRL